MSPVESVRLALPHARPSTKQPSPGHEHTICSRRNIPQFPDHALLGEENVEPGAEASTVALKKALEEGGSDWLWIVDPIDGTTNFVHGMPLSAVSIGVAYKGQLVVGEQTCRSCLSMALFCAAGGLCSRLMASGVHKCSIYSVIFPGGSN